MHRCKLFHHRLLMLNNIQLRVLLLVRDLPAFRIRMHSIVILFWTSHIEACKMMLIFKPHVRTVLLSHFLLAYTSLNIDNSIIEIIIVYEITHTKLPLLGTLICFKFLVLLRLLVDSLKLILSKIDGVSI